jgi:hypothetical protein
MLGWDGRPTSTVTSHNSLHPFSLQTYRQPAPQYQCPPPTDQPPPPPPPILPNLPRLTQTANHRNAPHLNPHPPRQHPQHNPPPLGPHNPPLRPPPPPNPNPAPDNLLPACDPTTTVPTTATTSVVAPNPPPKHGQERPHGPRNRLPRHRG